jgi:hypothetical protein
MHAEVMCRERENKLEIWDDDDEVMEWVGNVDRN